MLNATLHSQRANTRTHPAMKKKTLLITLELAIASVAQAMGVNCIRPNGTGWHGRFPCPHGGGDGIFGN